MPTRKISVALHSREKQLCSLPVYSDEHLEDETFLKKKLKLCI